MQCVRRPNKSCPHAAVPAYSLFPSYQNGLMAFPEQLWLSLGPDLWTVPWASLHNLHTHLLVLMAVSGVPTFVALFYLTAPYGRYNRPGWGVSMNARLAWMTQEVPSLLVTLAMCLWTGKLATYMEHPITVRTLATGLFLTHYTYRSLMYPCLIQPTKNVPLSIWAMSFTFCCWNGFLQGYSLSRQVPTDASVSVMSALGFALQILGLINVIHADHILIHLRKPGETGYKIPHGGMFNLVSAGNYASEILEWTGYALASQTPAAAAFAFFTFCNLAPRGVAHHKWYHDKFEDYPANRKAIIPLLW